MLEHLQPKMLVEESFVRQVRSAHGNMTIIATMLLWSGRVHIRIQIIEHHVFPLMVLLPKILMSDVEMDFVKILCKSQAPKPPCLFKN